jgi:SAM-dependent methyltransferase
MDPCHALACGHRHARGMTENADRGPLMGDDTGASPDAIRPLRPGTVQMGDLRRVQPISDFFGYDRGNPVDRYYIESFLGRYATDIAGHVLEIGDATYTRRFGGGRVTMHDVLHVHEGNPDATIVADLTAADHIPSDRFDCIIFTQTLHLLYDARAALGTLHRILRPRGVLLATFPGISQVARDEWGETWYWSFTSLSAGRMFGDTFGKSVSVAQHGNVLAATAFLYGLAEHELTRAELDYNDPAYPVCITVRAVKSGLEPAL